MPARVIDDAGIEAFMRDGYVVLARAFEPATAAALADQVWLHLPEDPSDRTSWQRHAAQIESIIHTGPVADVFTSRYCAALDELLGAGRWWTRRDGFGWVTLRFPGFASPPWQAPESGWHVDGIHFQHHVGSAEQGLVGLEMLTDVVVGGGGTCVKVGSHRAVARFLQASEPRGVSYAELRAYAETQLDVYPTREVTGCAGDVLLMHPFLAHARGPNVGQDVRIAANRCVALHEPMRTNRARESDLSVVERATFLALREFA